MKSVVDELRSIEERCKASASQFDAKPLAERIAALRDACTDMYDSWSGSWIGYQARVYLDGFHPRIAEFFFDRVNGLGSSPFNNTAGPWREYTYDEVVDAIKERSGVDGFDDLVQAAEQARRVFDECQEDLFPTLAALAHERSDEALQELNKELKSLDSSLSASTYIEARRGSISQPISDMRAVGEGAGIPPHIQFEAWVLECSSPGFSLRKLAGIARRTARYLERVSMTKQASRPESRRIFIGHGRSAAWIELKEFLCDRLGLEHDEFNREAAAGLSFTQRLSQMLDACNFAFLVFTAEDEHADGSRHARENVIHELGLTQGRYGFERAVVVLEEGCEQMSNINGLVQIRFPAGGLRAASEDIRRVLEREGMIPPTAAPA